MLAALDVEAVAPGGAAAGPGPVWPGGPYLGLVPFEERDARFFYGRDELADRLAERLAERPGGAGILLVAGESGSGQVLAAAGGVAAAPGGWCAGSGVGAVAAAGDPAMGSPLRELAMALAEMAGAVSGVGVPVAVGGAG